MAPKRHAYKVVATERNSSGRIGIFRTIKAGVPVWVATWQDIETGNIRRSQFSVLRWGEDCAREKAEAKRSEVEAMLAEAFGAPGVSVQHCRSTRCDGWQVRWWEPTNAGRPERMTLFFSIARFGQGAEEQAEAFANQLRRRFRRNPDHQGKGE